MHGAAPRSDRKGGGGAAAASSRARREGGGAGRDTCSRAQHAQRGRQQRPHLKVGLRLLQLASPALPVGAFNFSQGLEYANEAEWVTDERQAGEWILGVAQHGIATLDLPLLLRLHAAWSADDARRATALSRELLASRETAELRAEELHMGQALARILVEYGIDAARSWQRFDGASYAAMFALAGVSAAAVLSAMVWALQGRDRGKPTEIDVHSRFGTNYQLTTPPDNAPRSRDNTSQNDRLPSVGLKF